MSKIWIIVCGLIRNADCAVHQAREVGRLIASGRIQGAVLSTWKGELDRYPDVTRAFKAARAILVESAEPQLRLPGHVFHQTKSLLAALEHCPDDAVVMRIRPDIAPLGPEMNHLFDLGWQADLGERRNPAYSGRIWAHSGVWPWPLYVSDILFMGAKQDVQQLVDVDLKAEELWSETAPEQFFHLRRGCQTDPVIAMFARVQRGMRDGASNRKLLETLWQSRFWPRVLKAYAERLADDYVIGLADPAFVVSGENLNGFSELSVTALSEPTVRGPQFEYWPNLQVPIYHSTGWAVALREGRFRQDQALQRMMDIRPAGREELLEEAQELAHLLMRTFPDYRSRLHLPQDGRFVEDSQPGRYAVEVRASEFETLRAEITRLRRDLDDTNYALRLAQGR